MLKIQEFLNRYGLLAIEEMPPNGSNCTICFDMANDEDEVLIVHRLPCGHLFHKNCILRWLSCNNVCPNCRRQVDATPRRPFVPHLLEDRPLGAAVLLWPRGRPPVSTYVQRLSPADNSTGVRKSFTRTNNNNNNNRPSHPQSQLQLQLQLQSASQSASPSASQSPSQLSGHHWKFLHGRSTENCLCSF